MIFLPRVTRLAAALVVALFLGSERVGAETLYVSNGSTSNIVAIDSGGHGAVFASAGVDQPFGLAFDDSGNLYVANNGTFTILKFTPAGVGTTFATNELNNPISGMAFDAAGNLYASGNGNGDILKYAPDGTRTVFASIGPIGPTGLAFDKAGNLYVADQSNKITKFNPAGVVTLFANTGLNRPVGLAFDSAGNLYAVNYSDFNIVRFTPAGVGTLFFSCNFPPYGLTIDSANNLYLAHGTSEILRITPGGVGGVFANYATAFVAAPTFLAFPPLVIQPPGGFRVTAVLRSGNDLQISFSTVLGYNYVIQSCPDLSIGAWMNVPGTNVVGTGSIVTETIVGAFAGPPQFYRVLKL